MKIYSKENCDKGITVKYLAKALTLKLKLSSYGHTIQFRFEMDMDMSRRLSPYSYLPKTSHAMSAYIDIPVCGCGEKKTKFVPFAFMYLWIYYLSDMQLSGIGCK